MPPRSNNYPKKQQFFGPREIHYYLVIDFEATCDDPPPAPTTNRNRAAVQSPPPLVATPFPTEIIEFPCVLVSASTLSVVGQFHTFVRPLLQPKLTRFCQSLTGIGPLDVKDAPMIDEAMAKFVEWVEVTMGLDPERIVVVCDGPWDIERFLLTHIQRDNLVVPKYLRRYVNLRTVFKRCFRVQHTGSLQDMLRVAGLEFEGRPHSGIDDTHNISRLMVKMIAMMSTNSSQMMTLRCNACLS
eukprot:PhM_4_TR18912/c0_g1_i1/m.104940/K18416/THEX1, ERI1; 3'-5' exoribonuclease 1